MRIVVPGFKRKLTQSVVTSLLLSASAQTLAQTTISASQSTSSSTSATGDLTISSSGSVNVGAGAAVIIDSNNSVTNTGAISGADGQITGILVNGGYTGAITNALTINVTDSTLATTIPLTAGENRYGIQINAASPFIGTITNASTGTITVRGNDSAGIYLNQGGLTGDIANAGTIGITGNNSFGILTNATAPITGNIVIDNVVTALGTGAGGLQLNGSVSGQLDIASTIRADGYYNNAVTVARPTTFTGLTADNLLLGGPAVSILNNIGGGILVESGGDVVSFGSAPALVINPAATGSAEIGVGTETYGLTIAGSVRGNGIYDQISASAIQIGGSGGLATIDGGIGISGKVLSTAYAANATGISILAGGVVPSIVNSGTIQSVVQFGQGTNAALGGNSTAILVNGGALSAITNTGTISATSTSGKSIALDLAGDIVPVTVTQAASGITTASSITGDVLFGASGATLNLDSGTLTGAVSFGASTANALTIDNGAILGGAVTQASGGQLALDVANGRLGSTSISALTLSSLTLGSKGEIDFAVNAATGTAGSATVVGAVMIVSGAKVGLDFDTKLTSPETFTVIQTASGAGTLVGQPELLLGDVPYFYLANVVTDTTAGSISLDVRNRTFAEAGVMGSASAYNAVFSANYQDSGIRDSFNAAGTQQGFKNLYQQMLPSYSGGLFEVLAQGANTLVRTQADNPVANRGDRSGGWAQQFGFGAVDSTDSAPGYHGGGLGFAFGWETPASDISTWGVSVSYMRASVDDFNTGPDNQEVGTVYSAGLYWRETAGGFHTEASVNAGVAELNSLRNFAGTDLTGGTVTRQASSAWTGGMAQAHLGVNYEQPLGDSFYVKPSVTGDYFVLYEGSHNEHNGGAGFDLNIDSSVGKQGSVVGGLAFGMALGDKDFTWRPEVMVGYKQVFGGADNTVASFTGGSSFSLSPASQQGGAIAHIGIHGGNKYSDFAFEAGGEDRGDYRAFDGKIVARFQF